MARILRRFIICNSPDKTTIQRLQRTRHSDTPITRPGRQNRHVKPMFAVPKNRKDSQNRRQQKICIMRKTKIKTPFRRFYLFRNCVATPPSDCSAPPNPWPDIPPTDCMIVPVFVFWPTPLIVSVKNPCHI